MKPRPSLHQLIFDELNARSPDAGRRWQLTSPIVGVLDDKQAVALANQYWRVQLGSLPVSTTQVRECLVDSMDFDAWVYDFTKYVVPAIVANNLPA